MRVVFNEIAIPIQICTRKRNTLDKSGWKHFTARVGTKFSYAAEKIVDKEPHEVCVLRFLRISEETELN